MNTKVTVEYASGSKREFVASDELEKLIDNGEMFGISTMHSDMGPSVELEVSKMYAGNPMTALGNMMLMRRNAERMVEEDQMEIVIVVDTINACISLLTDQITSHQSGMSPVKEEN